MVLNHPLLIVLLFYALLILVLPTNSNRGFPHPLCSPKIRFDPFYLPHPTDCRKFYECDLGLAYEFQCPSEMYFNFYTNGCDTPKNALCPNDYLKIYEESSQTKTRAGTSELPITTELNDLSTTETSLDTQTLKTSQENNSVNRIASNKATPRPKLVNISNHISHHIKTSSRPNVASDTSSSSRKNYWTKSTKPANAKEKAGKGISVDKFFSRISAKQWSTEQQTTTAWRKHHNLIVSTIHETVSRTTRSGTSTYNKKESLHLKHKNIALQPERTAISRGDLKKIVFFEPIANNVTIGENSVVNKLPVNKRKDWTKTNLSVKWKKQ